MTTTSTKKQESCTMVDINITSVGMLAMMVRSSDNLRREDVEEKEAKGKGGGVISSLR